MESALTSQRHVSIFKNHEFDALFWVPVYIWVLDRLIRVIRIILFHPRSWAADCLATYNPSSNIVRLVVPVNKSAYKVKPGTFFYLMILDDSRPWESHPFTVAYVSSEYSAKSLSEQAPLLDSDDDLAQGGEDDLPQPSKPCMTFLIRPYDSQTRRLQELAASELSSPAPLRVMVDGPYGHSQALAEYDHVLFIVGGSGVVTALSYLRSLTHAHKAPKVEIHWAVREPAFAREVLGDIAELFSRQPRGRLVHLFPNRIRRRRRNTPRGATTLSKTRRPRACSNDGCQSRQGGFGRRRVWPSQALRRHQERRRRGASGLRVRIDYFEESFRW